MQLDFLKTFREGLYYASDSKRVFLYFIFFFLVSLSLLILLSAFIPLLLSILSGFSLSSSSLIPLLSKLFFTAFLFLVLLISLALVSLLLNLYLQAGFIHHACSLLSNQASSLSISFSKGREKFFPLVAVALFIALLNFFVGFLLFITFGNSPLASSFGSIIKSFISLSLFFSFYFLVFKNSSLLSSLSQSASLFLKSPFSVLVVLLSTAFIFMMVMFLSLIPAFLSLTVLGIYSLPSLILVLKTRLLLFLLLALFSLIFFSFGIAFSQLSTIGLTASAFLQLSSTKAERTLSGISEETLRKLEEARKSRAQVVKETQKKSTASKKEKN